MGGVFSKCGAALITSPTESAARPAKGLCGAVTSPLESNARPAKRLRVVEDVFENYDIFISHRGPDTKMGFVGFLDKDLRRVGLHPFLDRKSIVEGQECWECIEHAIQRTPLALVIFSEGFTQSEWCLKELHTMLACPSVRVLPIFYNVKPWELRILGKGQLATGFEKLIGRHDKTIIEEWRADLKQASDIRGWEYKLGGTRLETNLVQEVVARVFELANKSVPLHVGDHVVGVNQVAENLIQIVGEKKVLMLGLWGMGGIGKSTLARELYNQLEKGFDVRCYVEDVAEKVHQGGVTSVQNLILKALCANELMQDIVNKSEGKVILEDRLSKKSVLVVLDDVCDDDQMKYLMSRKMLLKEGSICIVTSRDCCVFEKLISFDGNDEVYTHDVQLLSQEDSRIVFASHAFGSGKEVPHDFKFLIRDISMACGGVPLVLEVCGSLLKGEKDVKVWNQVLGKLKDCTIINDEKIFGCLRISYDSLSKERQEIFLDIACALLGQSVEMAKLVWRYGILDVQSLVEKALIRVDEGGALGMHDHLRDMGRAIARDENLVVCKRLWGFECLAMLENNEGLLDSLETLILPRGHGVRVDLSLMQKLRIFICEDGLFLMSSIPKHLRWLQCMAFTSEPLRYIFESPKNNELVILLLNYCSMERLPATFLNLSKLKGLTLRSCDQLVELPDSFKTLSKLEVLNLGWCSELVQLPNSFGGLQNLMKLNLRGSGIQCLPESFGTLTKLEVLNLRKCSELVQLPNSFGGLLNLKDLDLNESGIQNLPESFGTLNKLEVLNLGWCSELVQLPNSFGGLQNLMNLNLESSGIQSLSESFGSLSKLEVLNLGSCSELLQLPNSFGGLRNLMNLNLESSGIQKLSESFGTLTMLEVLNLGSCSELVQLPNSFGGLQNLMNLNLRGTGFQSLSESFGTLSKLEVLNLSSCSELVQLPNSFGGLQNLMNLNLESSGIQSLPESFGTLNKLEVLNLRICSELVQLPNSFEGLQNLMNLNLESSGIQSLPKSFGTLSKLEVLNLGWCSKLVQLPNSFGGLQNLMNLSLESSGIQSLPESFGTLSKLEVLNLGWCSELVQLPNSFGGLQNLMNLNLRGTGFQSLSESFGTLSKLEVLNLSSCSELVQLPNSFGGLQNLMNLNLESSGIQSLPKYFGTLSKLEVLNLGWCSELVQLPNSLGGLQNLMNLNLESSGIQSLPESFGTLSKLEVLNLGWCSKLVQLPNSFGDLQNLMNLNLYRCGIQSLP